MRTWMVYLVLGGLLDVIGLFTLLTHLGKTLGVVGMMVGIVGVVFTRSGVLMMRQAKAKLAAK